MIDRIERVIREAPLGERGPFELILRHGGGGPWDTNQAIVLSGDGRPVAVVKVARGPLGRDSLRREHENLRHLAATLLPRRPRSVPRPLHFDDDGDYAVLVESHLHGKRLKDMDPREVAERPGLLDEIVDWLVEFTLARGPTPVSVDERLLREHVEEPVAAYGAAFDLTVQERSFLASLPRRLREGLGPTVPLVAGHGDFSDANVIVDGGSVGVVDWDEPFGRTLPGCDLFYLFCSLAATRHGLGRREGFERGFAEAFFAPTAISRRFHGAWETYRSAVGLPGGSALPLFALAWVRFALHKLRYLEVSGGLSGSGAEGVRRLREPQSNYPVTFFAEGRCLNVTITAECADAFAL